MKVNSFRPQMYNSNTTKKAETPVQNKPQTQEQVSFNGFWGEMAILGIGLTTIGIVASSTQKDAVIKRTETAFNEIKEMGIPIEEVSFEDKTNDKKPDISVKEGNMETIYDLEKGKKTTNIYLNNGDKLSATVDIKPSK